MTSVRLVIDKKLVDWSTSIRILKVLLDDMFSMDAYMFSEEWGSSIFVFSAEEVLDDRLDSLFDNRDLAQIFERNIRAWLEEGGYDREGLNGLLGRMRSILMKYGAADYKAKTMMYAMSRLSGMIIRFLTVASIIYSHIRTEIISFVKYDTGIIKESSDSEFPNTLFKPAPKLYS